MKRELRFEGDHGERRFELCYEALCGGGDQKGDRNRATIRKEARLFDALELVSDPDPVKRKTCTECGRLANPDARLLKSGGNGYGPTVTIQQEDWELLVKYVDSAPWLPRSARAAVDVQDWLSAAKVLED